MNIKELRLSATREFRAAIGCTDIEELKSIASILSGYLEKFNFRDCADTDSQEIMKTTFNLIHNYRETVLQTIIMKSKGL